MARTYEELKAEMAEKRRVAAETQAAEDQAAAVAPVAPAPTPGGIPAYLLPPPEVAEAPTRKRTTKRAAPVAPSVTRLGETRPAKPQEIKTPAQAVAEIKAPLTSVAPQIETPPDVRRAVDWKKVYDFSIGSSSDEATKFGAEALKMRKEELQRLAQAQGVDLEGIYQARAKGRTYDEIARANRDRGVLGFMPVAEREAAFRKTLDDYERAARGEAADTIELKKSGADEGMSGAAAGAGAGALLGSAGGVPGALVGAAAGGALGATGYLAAGTHAELPEVSKAGEYGHLISETLVRALQNDQKASQIYDLYGRKQASGNTQKYIEERTQDLMRRAGVGPSDPESFTKRQKLRRRAINEVLAYKTIGMWTPAITMQDVQVTEGAEAPGIFAALGPNIELVGLNNKGQAVYRQESPMGVLFRAIDMPQAALVGALGKEGAAAGVQTGANFLEYALEHTEDEAPYIRWPAVALGGIVSAAAPDLILGPGMAASAAKNIKKFYDVRKIAPRALELLTEIAQARKLKDMARAREAEVALRDFVPEVATQLDRYDAATAMKFHLVDPVNEGVFDENISALLASLDDEGAKALAAERAHLHPSLRKPETAAKMPTKEESYASFDELFNSDVLEKRIADAKAAYIAAAPTTVAEHYAKFARGAVRSNEKFQSFVKMGLIDNAKLDELAKIVEANAPTILSPGGINQWKRDVQAALAAHPTFSDPKFTKFRQAVYTQLGPVLERRAKTIAGMDIADLNAADVAAFDKALGAVERNNEARGIGAALLHKELADQAKIRVTPIELFDDVALKTPEGKPIRLTAGGLLFLSRIRKLLPEAEFDVAYAEAQIIDRIIVSRAKKEGRDAFDVYNDLFPEIRSATKDDIKRFKVMAAGGGPTPLPTPAAAPSGTAAAATTPAGAATGAGAAITAGRARLPVRRPRTIPETLDLDVTESARYPGEELNIAIPPEEVDLTEAGVIPRRAAARPAEPGFAGLFQAEAEPTARVAGEPIGEPTAEVTRSMLEPTQEIPRRRIRAELVRQEADLRRRAQEVRERMAPFEPTESMPEREVTVAEPTVKAAAPAEPVAPAAEAVEPMIQPEVAAPVIEAAPPKAVKGKRGKKAVVVAAEAPTPEVAKANAGAPEMVTEPATSQFRSMDARANSLRGYIDPEQRPVAATLFSGGGLIEAGLQNVVRPGYAVEVRGDIAAHYGKVFGEHVEHADVRTVDFTRLADKIDYLHASPVCKNFSAAKAVNAAGEQALDLETSAATARALDALKPRVFTLENVADYANSDAMKLIEDALTRNGYTFDKNVYNAADYGGATTRKRLILRAVREGELPPLPAKTGPADWYERVSDLVDELPKSSVPPWMAERLDAAGVNWRNADRPLMIAGGSAGKNVPYAYAGGPTFTIKATPKEQHRIILPGGDVRVATPRVLARITGLPDDYPLPKIKDAAVTIIGNGVPLEMTDAVIAPLIESRYARPLEELIASPVGKAEEAVSAALVQPSSITPAAAAPVVAAETSRDFEKSLEAVKKLRTPKATEKFLRELEASALPAGKKAQVYDSLATKLEKLSEAEGGDDVLETLADTARTAERRNRQEAERILREGGGLKQTSPTGDIKGVTELRSDGRSVIILFEGADPTTVLHEVAHVVRRHVLDQDDMNAITRWLATRGVNVTHQYGEFVGTSDEVEKAEEFFAKAFEQYALEGVAPSPTLKSAFDALKQAVAQVYLGVTDPVIGVNLQPEVRRVFDNLLSTVDEQANTTLMQVMRRELLGVAAESPSDAVLVSLSREAQRKGIPHTSLEDLQKQLSAAAKRNLPGDQIYVSFPVPVHGKKDWSLNDLGEFQTKLGQETADRVLRKKGVLLDLSGKGMGTSSVLEDNAVEELRSYFAYNKDTDEVNKVRGKTKAVMRGVIATFFGGDVVSEKGLGQELLRKTPPEFRKAVDAAAAVVEQAIGDGVTLVNDALERGKRGELYRYLGGGSEVRRVAGRSILSAGHDYMGSVLDMVKRAINELTPEEQRGLELLAEALNLPAGPQRSSKLVKLGFDPDTGNTLAAVDAAVNATREAASRAMSKLLFSSKSEDADFGVSLGAAIRNAVQAPSNVARPTHEMPLVESLTYLAGLTARDGKMFSGTPEEAVKILLEGQGARKGVAQIYDEESARRLAIVIGGFGSAALGKDVVVGLNLGIDAPTFLAFKNWTMGQSWDPEYSEAIQRIVNRYGYNIEFVRDPVLDTNFYIPRIVRERMAETISKSIYRPTAQVTGGDAFNILYRYMKTRMTRGSFFIRPRYFTANTVDHFMQASLTAGFGVGAASVSRVLVQDLTILPFWQHLVMVVQKLPGGQRIPPDVLERVRAGLQVYGDKLSNLVGTLFSVGKYRIEVNPILDGLDGGFEVGGKVYLHRQIRDVAVQEKVFASYDTRQLARVIEKEGALFVNTSITGARSTAAAGGGIPAGLRRFLADWEQTVADTAEAWGERERLGMMITLMEAGHDPRTAARITVDALYDYSGSMTQGDRSMLVGILFPFWAFQKNANQQVFNNIFSPWGAYRMMVLKRARDRSAELLTEVLYNDVGGEFGVDVKSMPPDLQDTYNGIVTAFYNSYNGEEPPEDAKRALRMLFTGRGRLIEEGKLAMLSPRLQELRDSGRFADLQQFAEYTALRPSVSGRSSYLRDRTGIAMLFPRTKATQMYYRLAGDDHSYMELFFPESAIESGMRHHTQIAAAYMLMAASALDLLPGVNLKEGGLDEVKVQRVLQPVLDPSRSPVIGPLLSGSPMGAITEKKRISTRLAQTGALVTRVHPFIGKMMDDMYGTTFVRVPAVKDPFVTDPNGNLKELSEAAAQEIRELQKQYPDAGVLRDQRYYLPGGVWTTMLANSPLGELNDMLIRYEDNPLERNDIRGEIMSWSRGVLGLDISLTSPQQVVKFEEPKKLTETPGTR